MSNILHLTWAVRSLIRSRLTCFGWPRRILLPRSPFWICPSFKPYNRRLIILKIIINALFKICILKRIISAILSNHFLEIISYAIFRKCILKIIIPPIFKNCIPPILEIIISAIISNYFFEITTSDIFSDYILDKNIATIFRNWLPAAGQLRTSRRSRRMWLPLPVVLTTFVCGVNGRFYPDVGPNNVPMSLFISSGLLRWIVWVNMYWNE